MILSINSQQLNLIHQKHHDFEKAEPINSNPAFLALSYIQALQKTE